MTEERARHWCGGTLVFLREPDGTSLERCGGCGFYYSFERPPGLSR